MANVLQSNRAAAGASKKKGSKKKAAAKNPKAEATGKAPEEVKDRPIAEAVASQPKSKLPKGRGRPSQSQEKISDQAAQNTVIILAILNSAAGMAFGEEARMTDAEYKMSEEPLQRQLERLDFQAAEMVGSYMDPIVLILGFLGWGSRIWRLKSRPDDDDRGNDDQEGEPKKEPPPPSRQVDPTNHDGPDPEEESEPELTGDLVPADIHRQMPGHS